MSSERADAISGHARRSISPAIGLAIILLTAVGGLLYVKWLPYYHRAFVASATHSIGRSILMGDAGQAPAASLRSAIDYAIAYGKAVWQALVLGLLLGSALQELAPPTLIARALGRPGWRSVAMGGLLSIPGMMCTCCAAPVVIGLRRRRATASSAIAFWLGNTVLNPATLVFMGFVLGWRWTALRLAFGILMVFGVAYLVNRIAQPEQLQMLEREVDQLAARETNVNPTIAGWFRKFLRLALGLIPEYLVLVLLLGATRAWLFPHIGPDIGNNLFWIALMAAAGLIFVIPTAGEVPIVQAMLALGIGAGPAAALLLTLPPVSLPSLAMTKSVFTLRVLGFVAAAVLVVGIIAGLAAVALGFHG
jgi:uncharacterized membrane protein YraQ (UPF0718 family)